MRRVAAIATGLALTAGLLSAAASAAAPVRLAVSFGEGARLGASAPMSLSLRVDSSLAPVTEFRVLTPPGLTLTSSRLGVAECRRPASEVVRVMGPVRHRRCPANSLMGTGYATAGLLLDADAPLFGDGFIELHSGTSVGDKPGLLVTVDTYNPVRIQLTYAGYLYVPPAPFGVGLAIMVPPIPHPPFGAPVALSTLHLSVGGPGIVYYRRVHGRRVGYHPGGLPLPRRCPAEGFRFRTILRFADGTRRSADAVVPCPPSRR